MWRLRASCGAHLQIVSEPVLSTLSEPINDLSICDREPIHIPGSIQPHGFLVACGIQSWVVTHVSENIETGLGRPACDLLGKPIDDLLSDRVVHDLRNTLQASMVSGSAETLANVEVAGLGLCDISIHMSGDTAVLEIVPKAGGSAETITPLVLIRSMLARLKRAPTLDRALSLAASQLRAVTGFDRVLMYKFLENGSGQVIAEAVRSGLQPFLGLHYPASDIPRQARDLYLRQWLRAIPQVDYQPAQLLAIETAAGVPLDLSLATLRSVSPIHLEYLRNMGSAATLTISLITQGRLWGLISCHHEVPRRLAASTSSVCELFGQMFSLQIEAKEQERELSYISRSREAHEKLIASMPPEETLFDNLALYKDLLTDLIPSDGLGIWTAGIFSGTGILPPMESIGALVEFLSTKGPQEIFATDALDQAFPPARAYRDLVSGVVAIPFSRAPRDYLFFFRREILQVVSWGGNPNKAVEVEDGHRIGPRKSFESWREEVSGHSKPWHPAELKIAEALRVSLLDVIVRRADLVERERRSAQESQALLIAELNHRVKNILALIRSLVRQSRHGATTIADFTSDLESRIRALAFAHDQMTQTGWTWAPLRRLLDAEIGAWSRASRPGLVFEGPDALLDPRCFQTLALVFHELMTNAVKYGSLSSPNGTLSVTWSFDRTNALKIAWREMGGPPVRAPRKRGFGSLLVEQSVPFELQGEAEITYQLEGVAAHFTIPADHVRLGQAAEVASLADSNQDSMAALKGKRLLIVEDSMMIALDAQAALQGIGADVDISGTATDAKRAIDLEIFDGAVLDVNLAGETSFGVADRCTERRLPFVFATGYGESVIMPERFRSVPIVSKPYDEVALQRALGAAALELDGSA